LMALLLAGSAFFSASETALFSIPRYQLRQLQKKAGLGGRSICALIEQPPSLLVTVLLGNMFVNVLYSSLAVFLGMRLSLERGYHVFVIVESVSLAFLIVFGEVVPKSVAVNRPLVCGRVLAPVLVVFKTVIMPLRVFFELLMRGLTAVVLRRRKDAQVSLEDLGNLVEVGRELGLLTPRENELLREVLEFATIEAREVMTPRINVRLYDIDGGREKLLKLMRESKHSKFPVYRGEPDNIVGTVHAKDVFLYPEKPLSALVRPAVFFPETAKIDQVLRKLLAEQRTIAMVVDEYGGLEGIVTIEDIVEEIVGEIEDEFDKARRKATPLAGGRFLLSADLSLREWSDICHQSFRDEAVDTVGGLVAMHLDRLPRKGDSVQSRGYSFKVLRVVKDVPAVILAEKVRPPRRKGKRAL